jgi:3-hydroxyacyl-[acyl-carrier-protein] dehydratase
MTHQNILAALPYAPPFLFVDELEVVSSEGCSGFYTFKKEADFYKGHFKDHPITPGVILTECMAQIGVVCLGIYLLGGAMDKGRKPQIALTSHQMDFYIPVLPGETVRVCSEKEVFRFNKLKCRVKMFNSEAQLVARGSISGMLKITDDHK